MTEIRRPETRESFEQRKRDHIRIALDPRTQTSGGSGLDRVQLIHEALPDLNFEEISLATTLLNQKVLSPFFISSMTAGHEDGFQINSRLAQAAQEMNWLMGVGSQRKELIDQTARNEWKEIRKIAPKTLLVGNLGLAQVIHTQIDDIQRMVDSLEAVGLFVHLNPLQEVLQPEGTPSFRGGFSALAALAKRLSVPVIVKETGCGMSQTTLQRLAETGVQAIDVSGFGGTHWGRIEGYRSEESSLHHQVAQTFKDWGISTVESVISARKVAPQVSTWASGGVRTGLDGAKLIALGAEAVGIAKPLLESALVSKDQVIFSMKQFEYELKVAMFCTGIQNVTELRDKKVWTWN